MSLILDPVKTYSAATPNRIAVGDTETGQTWSWRQLDGAANRLANWLIDNLGAASRARVATLTRNHPNMLVLQIACARAGAIFVPFNWRLAQAEIAVLIADAQPKILFHDVDFAVPDCTAKLLPLAEIDGLGNSDKAPDAQARLGADEPMTILYTSGTSGTPKGVIVTEANAFWGATNFCLGSLVSYESVFLADMPMFHTAGLFALVRVSILAGGTVWISPGFDPVKTIANIANRELGITHYFSVPQMATTLWQHPDFTPQKFSQLKLYVTGGAPNPKAQAERFGNEGIRFSDGFGMTETCSIFAMPVLDWDTYLSKAGSCGVPLLSVQTKIVDANDQEVEQGETGELWLKGPSITPGYWQNPEATAKAFSEDGWFKTGDAAVQDQDGYFFLVDRKKDMYISGGENVYPAEVEQALAELDDIAEAAVIGVPDARWGEVGRAFVVVKAGGRLSEQDILGHCLNRLAKFKVPKSVALVDELPRTASGKVQKHLLKNQ